MVLLLFVAIVLSHGTPVVGKGSSDLLGCDGCAGRVFYLGPHMAGRVLLHSVRLVKGRVVKGRHFGQLSTHLIRPRNAGQGEAGRDSRGAGWRCRNFPVQGRHVADRPYAELGGHGAGRPKVARAETFRQAALGKGPRHASISPRCLLVLYQSEASLPTRQLVWT